MCAKSRLYGGFAFLRLLLPESAERVDVVDRRRGIVMKMKFSDVITGHLRPPVLPDVIYAHRTSRKRVAIRRVVNRASSEFARLLHAQIPLVPLIQHPVREQRPGADAESFLVDDI